MNTKLASTLAAVAAMLFLGALSARAADPEVFDLTTQFRAGGVAVDHLKVLEVGGIVVIRGMTADAANAAAATEFARSHGYTRVANLVQISEPANDAVIQRAAERELAAHHGLDGCRLRVSSHNGVVHVGGKVHEELQREMAVQLLRNLDGVRGVQADLSLF